MYQQLTLVGNLGTEPELRILPSGQQVCNFNLATNRKWKDGNGNDVKETTWFRISVWNGQAETVATYLHKGDPAMVIGRLRPDENGAPRTFQRQDGTVGAQFEVTAQNVRFLPKGGNNGNAPAQATEAESSPQLQEDEEIPF